MRSFQCVSGELPDVQRFINVPMRWYLLCAADFQDVITGSAQPQITIGHLSAKRFEVPSREAWASIVDAYFAPLLARIVQNELQAQTLATLRDTLLPRLVSGQLRLPEVLAEMEEAA